LPPEERLAYERTVLFPLAGLDPSHIEQYHRVLALKAKLEDAKIEAARRYLDGHMSREETSLWLVRTCRMTPAMTHNRLDFIERYRTYIVNYTLGRQLVAGYIEKHSAADPNLGRRWQLFLALASTPRTPSGLIDGNWGPDGSLCAVDGSGLFVVLTILLCRWARQREAKIACRMAAEFVLLLVSPIME
jgi:hypothetical protein